MNPRESRPYTPGQSTGKTGGSAGRRIRTCAVIPVFNSSRSIGHVVRRTRRHVDRVVVVDDGCTDNTPRIARDAGAHVLGGLRNRGKGHALGKGFAYVLRHGFDAALTLDADLQHDPDDIPAFLRHHHHNGADLIIGDRMHAKALIPKIRYIPNLIGTRCFSWLTGQAIYDSQCGFRLYHRRLLAALPMICNGFEAESDVLLRAGRHGYRIAFVPVAAIYNQGDGPGSFYRPVRDTYDICINFLKNWFWRRR